MAHTKAEFDEIYEKLKTCALVDLEGIMLGLSSSEADEFVNRLQFLSTQFARKAEYLDARKWDNKDHNGAVKAQNIVAKKVRKALGFSYPQHDINF